MAAQTESRVAMISGANRGIGLAVANKLAEAGWSLSLGVRDPAKLTAVPGGGGSLSIASTRPTLRRKRFGLMRPSNGSAGSTRWSPMPAS